MKSFATAVTAVLVVLTMAGPGSAVAESPTVATNLVIEPHTSIYKEVPRPVSLFLSNTVTPPTGALTMKPMTKVRLNFPPGLIYVPNDKRTPPCPLSKIGPDNTNFTSDTAISLCGDSLVGNGTANLFLAQSTGFLVTDSVVLMFNAGRNSDGDPVMNLHGYSPSLNTGIFMTGTLIDGVFEVQIPRLTADSAVPAFTNDIPGTLGRDPDYAQASCPTGDWNNNGVITIAKRDANGVFSESENLTSPTQNLACEGLPGAAKFSGFKAKAPASVKSGKKAAIKVTVKNTGTASAKNVKVTASGAGKGSASGGTIKPGATKTMTVKARISGKNGKKATVKIKVSGGKAVASGKISLKVK